VTLIAVYPEKARLNEVQIIPFRRFKNKTFRVLFTWLLMFFKAIRVNARIYQIHDPELIPCGLMLRLLGKKVILDIHENIAEDIFDKPWIKNKRLLFGFFTFFEKTAVKYFHLFLAEISYQKRYQKLNARYDLILNYPDTDFFKPYAEAVTRNTNRLFYIGILLESRGLQQISEAIYILNNRGIRVEFDVVGELYTSLYSKLIALQHWNEVKDQIHFHGRLPLEKGFEISRQAAVGMCIIQPMKNSVESYPTKMFEYMAIGLPQVTSGFPLYRSVVEKHNCGICVNPASAEEIADAIETILSDRKKAETMRVNGLKNAPLYTWKTEAEKALSAYRKLLA